MRKRVGLLLFVVLVLSPFALISQNAQADRQLPANQPEMGMIYDGLEVARDGPCKGALRLKGGTTGHEHCTHGPEVAPASMNPKVTRPAASHSPQAASAAAAITVVCDGNGTAGQRVQVMYAHPAGTTDQFASYKTSIQQWAAEVEADFNTSAAQTGGNRHVRFVHDASCTPSVLDVTLSSSGASDYSTTVNELYALGYNHTDRKYMIFMDAHVYCGISDVNVDDQSGTRNVANSGPNYARIDAGCWSGVIAGHELMHTLGGVQLTAPHSDGNFHCTEGYDNMCDHSGHAVTTVCTNTAGDSWFDCNHNDYFSTSPAAGSYLATHWNTANSQFLFQTTQAPSAVTLTDMTAHAASSDPTQSATSDLMWALAGFSALALMALYALVVMVLGSREPLNA
jgi:hypothetical protein